MILHRLHFTQMNRLALFLALLGVALAAKLPKDWTKCNKNGQGVNECLQKAIDDAIYNLKDGNKKLGVFPIDPFHFEEIEIDQGSGPVSIDLVFRNMDLKGLSTLNVDSVEANWDKGEVQYNISVDNDVIVDGDYTINGKVLILPIAGDGKAYLVFEKMKAAMGFQGTKFTKGGNEYLNITNFDCFLSAKKFKINFSNLFNGDKALGDNMNRFLNENWYEILNELKPAISRAFGAAFKDVSNRIFQKVPLDQIINS